MKEAIAPTADQIVSHISSSLAYSSQRLSCSDGGNCLSYIIALVVSPEENSLTEKEATSWNEKARLAMALPKAHKKDKESEEKKEGKNGKAKTMTQRATDEPNGN